MDTNRHRLNPYLFVVGCPRSGTTMLQRMLDAHPLLAVANDSHFITHPLQGLPPGSDLALTPEVVQWVRTFRRFPRLGVPDDAVDRAAAASTTYGEFVSALYTELAAARGKRFAGEKTGGYVREIPTLSKLFPDSRFVHIIRDGRDVALSTRDWAKDGKGLSKLAMWHEDPVAVCALSWRRNVMAGRQQADTLGPRRYVEVRYEDLVATPEVTLTALATFLDLPDSPDMARYHVGRTSRRPGLSSKKAWLPPTPGLRNWRADLTATDQALFETLAGDMLSALGYERRFPNPTVQAAERARRSVAWWDRHVARRDGTKSRAEALTTRA